MSQTKAQLIDSAYESGAVLTGSTNNTITTVTGANAIAGEANLTFDGSQLGVGSSANYGTIGTAAAFQVQGTNTGSNTSINIVNAATSNASSTCDINAWQDYRLSTRIISGRENASNWTSSASAAASYLAFYTNSAGTVTERMRINSSGAVSKPYQPCFAAKGAAAWVSLTTGDGKTTLPMSSEMFDNGANYNNSNYRFTAPIAGKYVFFVQMYFKFDSNAGYYSNFFLKNGTEAQEAHNIWGYGSTGLYQDQTQNATYMVELAANDYVEYQVECEGDDSDFYGGHSTFSGYLLA